MEYAGTTNPKRLDSAKTTLGGFIMLIIAMGIAVFHILPYFH